MDKKIMWIIVAGIVVLFLANPFKTKEAKKMGATDVTRAFARTSVYTNSPVVVTYTPTAGDWSLDEILPAGWTVQGQTLYSQHLREYFSTNVPVTYTFVTPSSTGSGVFSTGSFQLGTTDTAWYVFPSQTVSVITCPGGTSTCDGQDNDCDYNIDESDEVASPPNCALQSGVCSGSKQTCSASAWQSCGASQYGANYQSTETTCDSLDNDCDGSVNENLVHAGANNALQSGVCSGSKKSCDSSHTDWFDDYSGVTSYVTTEDAKTTAGQCDNSDNDCDGVKDEPKLWLTTDASVDGDVDCSGCMENTEFTTYKNNWKQTLKTNEQFTELKNKWKTLVGCA